MTNKLLDENFAELSPGTVEGLDVSYDKPVPSAAAKAEMVKSIWKPVEELKDNLHFLNLSPELINALETIIDCQKKVNDFLLNN